MGRTFQLRPSTGFGFFAPRFFSQVRFYTETDLVFPPFLLSGLQTQIFSRHCFIGHPTHSVPAVAFLRQSLARLGCYSGIVWLYYAQGRIGFIRNFCLPILCLGQVLLGDARSRMFVRRRRILSMHRSANCEQPGRYYNTDMPVSNEERRKTLTSLGRRSDLRPHNTCDPVQGLDLITWSDGWQCHCWASHSG